MHTFIKNRSIPAFLFLTLLICNLSYADIDIKKQQTPPDHPDKKTITTCQCPLPSWFTPVITLEDGTKYPYDKVTQSCPSVSDPLSCKNSTCEVTTGGGLKFSYTCK